MSPFRTGELVDAGLPQEQAEGRKALRIRAQRIFTRSGLPHGAELDQVEGFAVQTWTLLSEDHRRAESGTDGRRRCEENGRRGGESDGRGAEVEGSLQGQVYPLLLLTCGRC
jgi:hypothetical protein